MALGNPEHRLHGLRPAARAAREQVKTRAQAHKFVPSSHRQLRLPNGRQGADVARCGARHVLKAGLRLDGDISGTRQRAGYGPDVPGRFDGALGINYDADVHACRHGAPVRNLGWSLSAVLLMPALFLAMLGFDLGAVLLVVLLVLPVLLK